MIFSRLILNVSCDHQALYSLGGVRVPVFETWPVTLPQFFYKEKYFGQNLYRKSKRGFSIQELFF